MVIVLGLSLRERPRQDPRGLISLFSALQGLPTKAPRKRPTKASTEVPMKVNWLRSTCPVFTCSVPQPISLKISPKNFLSKGFLHTEVLGEVSVLFGGQFGAKFFAKFFAKFSALFCWDIQSNKKNFSEKFSTKFP